MDKRRNSSPPQLFRIRSPETTNKRRRASTFLNTVKIKAGGAVNFIIGGFHQPIVYDDKTKPGDINVDDTTTTTGPTPSPPVPLIDDPANRIYRGLDPKSATTRPW
jgi:hypothetical protein